MRALLFLLAAVSLTAANRIPTYVWTRWFPETVSLTTAASTTDGVFVGGRLAIENSRSTGYVARLAADGGTRWSHRLDQIDGVPSNDGVIGGAADGAGNFWIVGRTLRSAAIGGIWSVGFVAGFNREGRLIRMHTLARDTTAQAVAIDAEGNAWISGIVTGAQSSFGAPVYGFVSRISPAGEEKRMLQMGGEKRVCSGGSGCIAGWGHTSLPHIAIGPGGIVAVAGSTSSVGMKVSPNAIQTSAGGGVLAILNRDGTPLFETYLGGAPNYVGSVSCGSSVIEGIAFDEEGMLYAGGINSGERPATTTGVIQRETSVTTTPRFCSGTANEIGFLYRIDPLAGRVLFSTLLGGETGSAQGLYVEGTTAWVGGTAGVSFPITPGAFTRGPGLLANIGSDGRSILQSARIPRGLEGRPIVAPYGKLFVFSDHAISAFGSPQNDAPVLFGAANAAGRPITESIVPGEAISLYGVGIGPKEPAHLILDHMGRIDTNLNGVRLFISGKAAPLLYADSEQINAIVPFGDYGPQASMELVHNDGVVARQTVRIAAADPAILGSCWNAEGKLNSFENPAMAGEIVSCWISGLGDLTPRPLDGDLPRDTLSRPLLPVAAYSSENAQKQLDVTYLGQALFAPAGVVQINFRVPIGNHFTLQVTAAGRTASATIYVRANSAP